MNEQQAPNTSANHQTLEGFLDKDGLQAQAILASITDAFFALDTSWRFVYINSNAEKLLRRSRQQLLGQNIWAVFPEAVGSTFYVQYHRAIEERCSVAFEEFYPPLETWFEVHAYPYSHGLSVYFRDINDRKRVEELLQRAHEEDRLFTQKLTALQEITNQLALAPDKETFYKLAVELGREQLGFDRLGIWCLKEENFIHGTFGTDEGGKTIDERSVRRPIPPLDAMDQIRHSPQAIAVIENTTLYNALGEPVGHGTLVFASVWNHNRCIGFLSADNLLSGQHFTPQRLELLRLYASTLGHLFTRLEIQLSLQESEERYRSLFRSIPDPVWVYDTHTLQFLDVSDAAIAHYGYSRDEFLKMTIRDIRPPEDWKALEARLAHLQPGYSPPTLWRHKRKDGTIFDVEITSHDTTYAGREARIVLARDVTERKRLETQLLQAQKMESIGRLAGGIAHDFNNLLAAIVGYLELLEDHVQTDVQAQTHLHHALQAAERAKQLTSQLLAFARKQITRPQNLDINRLIVDIGQLLRRIIGEDIELTFRPSSSLWTVKADRSQMEQVLMNLAVNSRDAMPHGGHILIETHNIIVSDQLTFAQTVIPPGEYVYILFRDDGEGMNADVLARIFEPFFTTKEVGKGTGLGLSTCYGIIRQAGGYIAADSAPQEGAAFHIFLPRSQEEPEASSVTASSPPASGTETILLVEDEPLVLQTLTLSLTRKGYHLLTAENPKEALEILAKYPKPIDLLITDVVMPEQSGLELVSQAYRLRPNLPVLYISGYTEEHTKIQSLVHEGIAFLQKPFTPSTLARRVREILDAAKSKSV
jgi:two-component system cell cycle sensor histidine kinase/response regulator CckA